MSAQPQQRADLKGKPLTEKQEACLRFIVDYIGAKGYPPAVSEVAKGIGVSSKSTAFQHMRSLERKGYIQLDGLPRALRVVTWTLR